MTLIILNLAATIIALGVIYGVWTTVHLLARRQLGDRKLGCRGPDFDELGNAICCHGDAPCESVPGRATNEVAPTPEGEAGGKGPA